MLKFLRPFNVPVKDLPGSQVLIYKHKILSRLIIAVLEFVVVIMQK